MLDVGLGVIPFVGDGLSFVNAISGKNTVTGKKLSTDERVLEVVVGIVGIASFGTLGGVARTAIKSGKLFKKSDKLVKIFDKGKEVVVSARKLGFDKAPDIKRNAGILQRWKSSFTKTKIDDALDVNNELAKIGYSKPPYTSGSKVVTFKPTQPTDFVRVHGPNNKAGRWVMNKADIEGLFPVQIKDKYALPEVPTYVSDTKVPSGTGMRMGEVAPNYGSKGGGTQLEVLDRVEFTNTRPIGDL